MNMNQVKLLTSNY